MNSQLFSVKEEKTSEEEYHKQKEVASSLSFGGVDVDAKFTNERVRDMLESETTITNEELQAMKTMVKEISLNPEKFGKYFSTLKDHAPNFAIKKSFIDE
jgi:hypothetical protein